jgi:hypothetical protein
MPERDTPQVFRPPHLLSEPLACYLAGDVGNDLGVLCSTFPKEWAVYLMGGLLRNLLLKKLRGLRIENADVDLVINGAQSVSELQTTIKSYWIRQNEFGGAKCRIRPNGIVFDVWRIDDHVTMSSAPRPHSISQLLKHNLLDVDAILVDLQTNDLYDYGCLAAIQRGRIDLLGKEGIAPNVAAAQAAHVTLIGFKTGFEMSDAAVRFVRHTCHSPPLKRNVVRIIARKMPQAIFQIEEYLDFLLREEPWPTMVT